MSKKNRRKFPRLPSGYGTIRYLGEGRRNSYAVHPPATTDALGHTRRPAAICYVDNWYKGFAVLTAYKAGTYQPGMEKGLALEGSGSIDNVVTRILADYGTIRGVIARNAELHEKTFAEVFEEFYSWKFDSPKGLHLSHQSRDNYKVAFKNCEPLHNRVFSRIKASELQENLDRVRLKHSSLELILTLYRQMYRYAIISEICSDDKSRYVSIGIPDDDEHGIPFSETELRLLWQHSGDAHIQMILIMCYSGFRITEYKYLDVHLKGRYLQGGIKTLAGKNRIVPIHSSIFPFVYTRYKKYGTLIPSSIDRFRKKEFIRPLELLGITGHTPHDCRHTFSMLCEKYGVRENDRKRMLGHAFQNDVTNNIYGHRTLEDLRAEIEKIAAPIL